MTTTEIIGFCDNVLQFMRENQAALEAAGMTAAKWIAELEAQQRAAVTVNAEQEALKAQLKAKTAETKVALNTAYGSASGKLDALIGTLGKGTPMAKQAARLRSGVLGSKRTKKTA